MGYIVRICAGFEVENMTNNREVRVGTANVIDPQKKRAKGKTDGTL
jgi:hypothetical protein